MREFKVLKEEQLSCLKRVVVLDELLEEMSHSSSDLLQESMKNASYHVEAQGLAKQLQNPNISLSVVAEVSNGKSTFLNALIFKDQVLHSGLGAVTARLFKIDYDEKFTLCSDHKVTHYSAIEALKEAVKNLNIATRAKMDANKEIHDSDVKEVDITLPHPVLQDGITIYDTPGFGSLDEVLVYPIIKEAVVKSDAVIILLDIAQGFKGGEKKFVSEVLKSIPADKRFVLFNKIDAVINEDQKLLMGEDELEEQLAKVQNDTLKELSSITGIDTDKIDHYALSASKALAGFVRKDQSKIDESFFENFETDFWHKVVNSKREVFENRLLSYGRLLDRCSGNVTQVKDTLEKNHTELHHLKNALIEKKAEFSAFSSHAIGTLDSSIGSFSSDSLTTFSVSALLEEIHQVLVQEIYESVEEINWMDKLQVWSIKEKYTKKIEVAIEEGTYDISQRVRAYGEQLIERLHDAQVEINTTISEINKKLESFSDLGVTPLDHVDILVENGSGEFGVSSESNYTELLSIDKEIFVMIGGLIAELVASRLVVMIPGIGLAIAAALAVVMKVYKSYNDPNMELAVSVANSIRDGLKEALSSEFEKYTSQTNAIKNAMTLSLLSAKSKLQMIENSFENPEEREAELARLKDEIAELIGYENRLHELKGSGHAIN